METELAGTGWIQAEAGLSRVICLEGWLSTMVSIQLRLQGVTQRTWSVLEATIQKRARGQNLRTTHLIIC